MEKQSRSLTEKERELLRALISHSPNKVQFLEALDSVKVYQEVCGTGVCLTFADSSLSRYECPVFIRARFFDRTNSIGHLFLTVDDQGWPSKLIMWMVKGQPLVDTPGLARTGLIYTTAFVPRCLTESEKELVRTLAKKDFGTIGNLDLLMVQESTDYKSVKKLNFISPPIEQRWPQIISSTNATFIDSDDNLVTIKLILDQYGDLCELNFYKSFGFPIKKEFEIKDLKFIDLAAVRKLSFQRHLTDKEKLLIKKMAVNSMLESEILANLDSYVVQDMADGGMGSIEIIHPDYCWLGGVLAEAEFDDADGMPVSVDINVDKKGRFFELDVWRMDSEALLRYPEESEINVVFQEDEQLVRSP